jgi:type IV pilus assembly protein PilB
VCPTLFGEKTVVRILDAGNQSLNIDDLGLDETQKSIFLSSIQKPQGMILVTGPTGSGKTLTLYSALNCLNSLEKNICTAEDPVEITLPGIQQVHVDSKIDLSFSKILRTFLRQDPDILMIGEIRDQETAETAIKAAQTGHLVFSTLHTNSAIEALTRLFMLGISPFNIAHSVQLIIAQRLVRKLCIHCKGEKKSNSTGIHCDHCINGYSGRIAVFEFLPLLPEIASMIIQANPIDDIANYVKKIGMINLYESGLNKAKSGITSLEEVQRVLI